MPFKSEAQRRLFYAKARRGEISKSTVKRWEEHTPKKKKLPEHVKSSNFAQYFGEIMAQRAANGRAITNGN